MTFSPPLRRAIANEHSYQGHGLHCSFTPAKFVSRSLVGGHRPIADSFSFAATPGVSGFFVAFV